jgi:hypothetical protein
MPQSELGKDIDWIVASYIWIFFYVTPTCAKTHDSSQSHAG